MFHWTYTKIFGKLTRYCEVQDVLVRKVPPSFTSQQRCTKGGWVQKPIEMVKYLNVSHVATPQMLISILPLISEANGQRCQNASY